MADGQIGINVRANIDGVEANLKKAESGVKNLSQEVGKATAVQDKMATSVKANAVPALTSFSQVIQDAPYVIRGVANNITQLTSQFGYLAKSTGGTGAALRAMIGSLAGPAGILFAVSAVTSLLVTYGDKLFATTKEINNQELAMDQLNETIKRQSELRKELNTELDLAAKAAALEAKLVGKGLSEQYNESLKFRKAEIQILEAQLSEARALVDKHNKQLREEWKKGTEGYEEVVKESAKNVLEIENKLRAAKSRLYIEELQERIRLQKGKTEIEQRGLAETIQNIQSAKTIINQSLTSGFEFLPITPILTQADKDLRTGLAFMKVTLERFNEEVGAIISYNISSTFAGIGNAIGDALATGKNLADQLGSVLLGGVGSLLIQLGELAIGVGVGLLAIKKAFESLNPVIAIAAGVALIALGAFVSAKSKAIGGNIGSTGGGGSSVGGSGSRSYSGSSVSQSNSGGGGGTYVFEIEGTKLVGVLSNTLNRNRSLGGSLSLV